MAGVEIAQAYVSVFPSTKGFGSKLSKELAGVDGVSGEAGDKAAKGFVSRFTGGLGGIAAGLSAAFAGVAVGGFLKGAVEEASSLGESLSKVNVVFGDSAGEITSWASTAATSIGQSRQQALEAAGTFGNLFRAMGITTDAASDMSRKTIELAGDLASFNNANPEDVLLALRSGLVGETEPLRQFGVNLNEARIKAEALRLGLVEASVDQGAFSQAQESAEKASRKAAEALKKYGAESTQYSDAVRDSEQASSKLEEVLGGKIPSTLDAATKAQAAYSLILGDTSLAQGDFARTSDGLANQQRILAAQWKDIKAQVGTALLPAVTSLVKAINRRLVPAFTQLSAKVTPVFKEIVGGFKAMTAAFRSPADGITSSGLAGALERLGLVARRVFDGIRLGFASFNRRTSDIDLGGFTGPIVTLGETARVVFDGIGRGIDGIVTAFQNQEITDGGLLGVFEAMSVGVSIAVDVVGTVLGNLKQLVLDNVGPATDAVALFNEHLDVIVDVATLVGPALIPMAAAFGALSIVNDVVASVAGISASLSSLLLLAVANPVGAVIAAVFGLGVAFAAAYKTSEPFREFVDGVITTIRDSGPFQALAGFLRDAAAEGGLFSVAVDKIRDAFGRVESFITPLLGSLDSVAKVATVIGIALGAVAVILGGSPFVVAAALITGIAVGFDGIVSAIRRFDLDGVIGSLKDFGESLFSLFEGVGLALFDVAKDIAAIDWGKILGQIGDVIQPLLDGIVSIAGPLLRVLLEVGAGIADVVGLYLPPLIRIIGKVVTTVFPPLVEVVTDVASIFTKVLGGALRLLAPVIDFIADHIRVFARVGVIAGVALAALLPIFGGMVVPIVAIAAGIAGVVIVIRKLYQWVTPLAKRLAEATEGFRALLKLRFQQLIDFLGKVVRFVATDVAAFAGRVARGFVTIVGGVIEAVKWIAGKLVPAFRAAGDIVTSLVIPALGVLVRWVIGSLVPALVTLGGWIRDYVVFYFNAWRTVLTEVVIPALGAVWSFIRDNVIPIIAAVAGWVRDHLVTSFQTLADFVINSVVPALSGLWAFIRDNVIPVVSDVARWLLDNFVANLQTLWAAIRDNVIPALSELWAFIRDNVIPIVVDAATKVFEFGRDAYNAIRTFVDSTKTKVGEVLTVITGLPGEVKTAIAGIVTNMVSLGVDLVQGLIDGIKSMALTLKTEVEQFINDNVPEPIRRAMRIASPSKVMRDIGIQTGEGLIEGLLSTDDPLKAAAEQLGKTTATAFSDAMPDPHDLAANVIRAVRDGFGLAEAKATAAARGFDVKVFEDRSFNVYDASGKLVATGGGTSDSGQLIESFTSDPAALAQFVKDAQAAKSYFESQSTRTAAPVLAPVSSAAVPVISTPDGALTGAARGDFARQSSGPQTLVQIDQFVTREPPRTMLEELAWRINTGVI